MDTHYDCTTSFCEICLDQLEFGAEDVEPAVTLVRTRDLDGQPLSLPMCERHWEAAQKLRCRYELRGKEPLQYRRPSQSSVLEMLVITAGVLKMHRDVLNATAHQVLAHAEQVINRHMERPL